VGDQIAFDCMKAAYDAGINFFDCAEAYAGGKSEEVMGQAILWSRQKSTGAVLMAKSQ
jgi:aryl-alcohol dehydrogenase-like predicted oxidoreductase